MYVYNSMNSKIDFLGLKDLLSKGRFLIAVFVGICIFSGSCHLSSGEASR